MRKVGELSTRAGRNGTAGPVMGEWMHSGYFIDDRPSFRISLPLYTYERGRHGAILFSGACGRRSSRAPAMSNTSFLDSMYRNQLYDFKVSSIFVYLQLFILFRPPVLPFLVAYVVSDAQLSNFPLLTCPSLSSSYVFPLIILTFSIVFTPFRPNIGQIFSCHLPALPDDINDTHGASSPLCILHFPPCAL